MRVAMVRQEVKSAVGALRRVPGFTVGVVVTLGATVAAALAAGTVVERVIRRPLPLVAPGRVVTLMEDDGRGGQRLASFPTVEDWRREARGFSGITFMRGETVTLGDPGERERAIAALVTPGFAATLGVRPLIGRLFTAEEEAAGGGGVAVITESVWQSRFGGDSAVLGRVIRVNDRPTVIVGVLPEAQRFPEWAEWWLPLEPLRASHPALENRILHVDSRVVARLAPGVDSAAAQRALAAVQAELSRRYPDPGGDFPSVRVTPLRDTVIGNVRAPLLALGGAAVMLILLVGANLGGLALLRVIRRQRDLLVRLALGASPERLVIHVVTEWVVLGVMAGMLGVVGAWGLLAVLRDMPMLGLPRRAELTLDPSLVAAGVFGTAVIGAAMGLLPVIGLRRRLAGGVGEGAVRGNASASAHAKKLRATISVVQMAVALVLLTGAALLLRSFGRMQGVDLGFRPAQVVAIDVFPPAGRFDDEAAAAGLYRRLVDAAQAIPGVEQAAFINHAPLGGSIPVRVTVPGVDPDPNGGDMTLYKTASESYAGAVGLRLVRGRWFTRAEVDARSTGVVVSEQVARRFWPDADPIGRSVTVYRSSQARPGFGEPLPSTVIGVVADVRHFGPAQPAASEIYLPFTREAWGWGSIVVRSALPVTALRRSLEEALRTMEPELPLSGQGAAGFRALDASLASWVAPRRVAVALAVGIGVLGTVVASLGLFGLVAYGVSQRTGEFGVRLALGATPGGVRRLVVREGLPLLLAGTMAGLVGSALMGRGISGQLVDTPSWDPAAFAAALIVLGVSLVAALYIPARRASRLSPTEALRAE